LNKAWWGPRDRDVPAAGVWTMTEQIVQIKLSEKDIEGFIAADKIMTRLSLKCKAAADREPNPKVQAKLQAELEAAAKKFGFKDFAHYALVVENITLIIGSLDPETGKFTAPIDEIKSEIESVKADKSIKAADRKTVLKDLNDALLDTQPIEFPSNVRLVKKHRAKIYTMVW
jgi:hypothetical protein